MVETADRSRVGEEPRGDPTREWEVFVRENSDDPLRHVGSVSAPSAEVAHEQSSRLFAWYADDLWLCPADEVRRFSTHDLAEEESSPESEESSPTPEDRSSSEAVVDEDETATYDGADEPRVTEL
ncbi:phenylacetic acid degradation protein B [Salinarchaeum sp. Harcht-Bsk1]|uniref:Htur_1727 family rSAM-partnered candidate RiPP n=1 Tax=Salinarchaeum sp. Harcht-Bsk1 TaxID=1333523 RepID=UPI0003423AA6|nr:Htur_1727 family rSAM-partnered candidate RiPP [Salinarchaeum sp. Harcht-Bsk1]AGN02777.1 phenylacetic acid degradation protein B [Salinarchaeum sp. Harcht-Bsk1]